MQVAAISEHEDNKIIKDEESQHILHIKGQEFEPLRDAIRL